MPSHFLPSSAKPAMASVSRWAQVFFTQSLTRPETYRLSADLRDDALKARLAGVLVHLTTIDLEALAELDIGFGDDFPEQTLTLEQRQPPEVIAIEVKQIERDHHDLLRTPLEFVLQHREVRGAVVCRDHHLAINDRRSGIDVPGIGCDLSET